MEILEHNVKETYVETEALDAELKAVSESKAEIGKKLVSFSSNLMGSTLIVIFVA